MSAAAAPCAPGRRGRPAGAPGTTWGSATRGWCVFIRNRTPTVQKQREEGSVRPVRLESIHKNRLRLYCITVGTMSGNTFNTNLIYK